MAQRGVKTTSQVRNRKCWDTGRRAGERHRAHRGRCTDGVFPGPSSRQRWARERDKPVMFWRRECAARACCRVQVRSRCPSPRSHLCALCGRNLPDLGFKFRRGQMFKLPAVQSICHMTKGPFPRLHPSDHSGGTVGGGPGWVSGSSSPGITQPRSGRKPNQLALLGPRNAPDEEGRPLTRKSLFHPLLRADTAPCLTRSTQAPPPPAFTWCKAYLKLAHGGLDSSAGMSSSLRLAVGIMKM